MKERAGPCLTEGELADYLAGVLAEDRERGIEEHLAGCQRCAEQARQGHAFLARWQRWSAAAHGTVFWQERADHALGRLRLADGTPDWLVGRLERWVRRWPGLAEAALSLSIGAGPVACVAETLADMVRPGGVTGFRPAVAGPRVRGTEKAADADGPVVLESAGSGEQQRIRVMVHGRRGDIRVNLGPLPPGWPVPAVVLVPAEEGRMPALGKVSPGGEPAGYAAWFRDVQSGEYLLLIEPLP